MPVVAPRGVSPYRTAVCASSLAVLDLVYISGKQGDRPIVGKVDYTDLSKMPARAIVVQKINPTLCVIQTYGPIQGLFSSLTYSAQLYVGSNGRVAESAPSVPVSGLRVGQLVGWAATDVDIDFAPANQIAILRP